MSADVDPIAELDPAFIDQLARDLTMTRRRVRQHLRDAIAVGLLSVTVTDTEVILRGEFPNADDDLATDDREIP